MEQLIAQLVGGAIGGAGGGKAVKDSGNLVGGGVAGLAVQVVVGMILKRMRGWPG